MTPTPIQILLIVFLIAIVLFYFNRLRTRLLDRVIFFTLALAGMVLVAKPDWANDIAHFLGVGRGADLLVYVGFTAVAFLFLALYTRQRQMDVRLTELARRMAILEGEKPKAQKKKSGK